MEAISRPAPALFTSSDAEQLARDLAQRRVRLANGKLALIAATIEPMHLQLACDERFQRGGRGAAGEPQDPDEALTRFYDLAVARAVGLGRGAQDPAVDR
jgi:hypothetical protein